MAWGVGLHGEVRWWEGGVGGIEAGRLAESLRLGVCKSVKLSHCDVFRRLLGDPSEVG
jgi:hypothetical protein